MFSETLPGFQEITKHNPETTKHVFSHQLLAPHGQGRSQPTKGTSERNVFHMIKEFSLSTITDLTVGVQGTPPTPPTDRSTRRKRKEEKRLEENRYNFLLLLL